MNSFSICIPTYNRAPLLHRCLTHLCTFADASFELIIGDNASTDDTPRVIAELAPKFRHLKVLRHAENLGFSRNIDATLRHASRPYLYVLSDDDFLFEGALHTVEHLMRNYPAVAAVVGQYMGVTRLLETMTVDFADARASFIAAKGYDLLLENFQVCDGHPFMRRELFQRHCAYWDRTIGVLPLCMRLLEYGDLAVIDKPLLQHLTNGESLSVSMTEARMLDMFNADFEIALSFAETRSLRGKLGDSRQRFMQNLYLQAARMSRNNSLTYLLWMFLKRLESVQGAEDDFMVKAESAFMHDFMVDRLCRIVCDAKFARIAYEAVASCELLVHALREALAKRGHEILAEPHGIDSVVTAGSLRLVSDSSSVPPGPGPNLALQDIFDQLRLTRFAARLATYGGRLIVQYGDLSTAKMLELANPAFQILCAPYAMSA